MTDKTRIEDAYRILGLTRPDEASGTHAFAAAGAPGLSAVAGAATLAGGTIGGCLGSIADCRL